MLTVLLESRAARQRRVGGTMLSMLVHGAIIASIVALTLPDRGSATPGPDVRPTPVTYVRPQPIPDAGRTVQGTPSPVERSIPRPELPVIDIPAITPDHVPPIDLSLPATTSDQVLVGRGASSLGASIVGPGTLSSGSGDATDVSAVDRAPRILGRAPEPRYPASLRSAGIGGHVLVEFVVDTTGRAEMGTLRFSELTNPLFGDAARDALLRYRFAPGEVAGRKVRTRVAVPFEFRLEK
jgi:protein TonB